MSERGTIDGPELPAHLHTGGLHEAFRSSANREGA